MATSHQSDPFTFFPFRKGDPKETEWSSLIKYIKQHFPTNYNSRIQGAVDKLSEYKRVIAATCTNDLKQPPNEAFIEQTLKPYVHLIATAQAHLPLHGGAIKGLTFEWRDSLDESYKHQSTNSNLETFSTIYNIAAAYAFTASVDAESGTVEGIKNAFKTYQMAAGCFQFAEGFLKRLPPALVVRDATVESLTIMQRLCLCQAHHCSYLKAEIEMKGKYALLSKMATEGSKLYDDVHKIMVAQGWPRSSVVKDIDNYTSNMSFVFTARAHLHLACERMECGEMGDAIARFNAATASLQRTTKFSNSSMNQWLQGIRAAAVEHHGKAVNANETVYFMRIPKELPPLEGLGKGLGKPIAPPPLINVISNRDADPFFGIVPAHIAEVAAKHFNSMQQLASTTSKSVATYRDRIRASLNALGVQAAIQSLSSENKSDGKLPHPLRAKILTLRPEAGAGLIDSLVNSVTQVEELRDASIAKMQAIAALLTEEVVNDEKLAQAYGERLWRGYRPQSMLTPMSKEIQKQLEQVTDQLKRLVTDPLEQLKATLSNGLRDLGRLDWPMDDLDALMPFTKTREYKEQTRAVVEAVAKLEKLLTKFDQIDEQNNQKLKELNEALQSDAVVHQLSAVDAEQHEAILDASRQAVEDLTSCIRANISSGDVLLETVQETMGDLAVNRSEDATTVEIQKICNMIETAIDLYQRLTQDVTDLARCATQSIDAAEGIFSTTESYVVSRNLEADDIKAALEAQIAAKARELEASRAANQTVLESQKRQEELKRELELLESQRAEEQLRQQTRAKEAAAAQQSLQTQTAEVDRNERVRQLLERQAAGLALPPPPAYPPPPPAYDAAFAAPAPAPAPFAAAPAQYQAPTYSYSSNAAPVAPMQHYSTDFAQQQPQQHYQAPVQYAVPQQGYAQPSQAPQPYFNQQAYAYQQAPYQQPPQVATAPPPDPVQQNYYMQIPHPSQFQFAAAQPPR